MIETQAVRWAGEIFVDLLAYRCQEGHIIIHMAKKKSVQRSNKRSARLAAWDEGQGKNEVKLGASILPPDYDPMESGKDRVNRLSGTLEQRQSKKASDVSQALSAKTFSSLSRKQKNRIDKAENRTSILLTKIEGRSSAREAKKYSRKLTWDDINASLGKSTSSKTLNGRDVALKDQSTKASSRFSGLESDVDLESDITNEAERKNSEHFSNFSNVNNVRDSTTTMLENQNSYAAVLNDVPI
ncbi:hypothetical protein V1511DRAFT_504024 [Dipodascopsis uninucleata]